MPEDVPLEEILSAAAEHIDETLAMVDDIGDHLEDLSNNVHRLIQNLTSSKLLSLPKTL